MGNIATVLEELSGRIDGESLRRLSSLYPTTTVQRLGYLLERARSRPVADMLLDGLQDRRYRSTSLVPGPASQHEEYDDRWRIIVNEEVEAELCL